MILTDLIFLNKNFSGKPTQVRVGDLNLKRNDDDARPQLRKIIDIIRHPDYKKPLEYHDIALIKMESPVKFDAYVRPACLPYGNVITENAIATGWGRVDWGNLSMFIIIIITRVSSTDNFI